MRRVGIEKCLIDQMVNIIPQEKITDQEIAKKILEERIVQGGNQGKNSEDDYIHIRVFEEILKIANTRQRAEFRTITEMRCASDEVIECYEDYDEYGFFKADYDGNDENVIELLGKKEGENYYQCYKDFVEDIILQACMVAHISHIYDYKISPEGLARVVLMIRSLIAKECERRKASYLLKKRICLIMGNAMRHILENHYPEMSHFDILNSTQSGKKGILGNDLGEEIITAVRREIVGVKRMELDGISRRRFFSGF